MSRKYKFRDDGRLYFVTFAVVAWIDVFTRAAYKDTFLDTLRYCQNNKGLELYAYCITPPTWRGSSSSVPGKGQVKRQDNA